MAAAEDIANFDDIIDVRTPSEFAEDCIPGALNFPALGNDQRREIGALYKRDPFAARLKGAGMVAENLAAYLRAEFAAKPPTWRPLVYCWRGGQRSGAVVEVLRRVGWRAEQLDGGYKTYRQYVVAAIAETAPQKQWTLIAGKTGAGKTALLNELAKQGAATLDLEALANHRGSVFGAMGAQPSQRRFETLLWQAIKNLPDNKPIFVESEGRKIGVLHIPSPLLTSMRAAPRAILITAPAAARAEHIQKEYAAYIKDEQLFAQAVGKIETYTGKTRASKWLTMHRNNEIPQLLTDMLQNFYDIGYEKSLRTNYPAAQQSPPQEITPANPASITDTATTLIARFGA